MTKKHDPDEDLFKLFRELQRLDNFGRVFLTGCAFIVYGLSGRRNEEKGAVDAAERMIKMIKHKILKSEGW